MVTTEVSIQLTTFVFEENIKGNNLEIKDNLGFLGHKENKSVYGSLFMTNKGLLFTQHKWVKTNNKTVPSVYAKEKSFFKFVEENIFNSFEYISIEEHSDRWGIALEKI